MIKFLKRIRYRHMLELVKTVDYDKLINVRIGMEDGWIVEPTGLYDAVVVALQMETEYRAIRENVDNNDEYLISAIEYMYKKYKKVRRR